MGFGFAIQARVCAKDGFPLGMVVHRIELSLLPGELFSQEISPSRGHTDSPTDFARSVPSTESRSMPQGRSSLMTGVTLNFPKTHHAFATAIALIRILQITRPSFTSLIRSRSL